MKRLLNIKSVSRLLLVAIIVNSAYVFTYPTPVKATPFNVDSHTQALWHLDESSGTTAADSSGHGNTGSVNTAAVVSGHYGNARSFTVPSEPAYTRWGMNEPSGNFVADYSTVETDNYYSGIATGTTIITGRFDKARSFNGSSDRIFIHNIPALAGNNSTREAWINVPSLPSNQQWIVGQNGAAQLILQADGHVAMNAFLADGAFHAAADPSIVPLNQWVYYSGVINSGGGSTTLTLYKNGSQVATSTIGYGVAGNNGKNFWIGGVYDPGDYIGQFFNGSIDEVTAFNYSRTGGEIATTYSDATNDSSFGVGDPFALISLGNITAMTGSNSTREAWIYKTSLPNHQEWIVGQNDRAQLITLVDGHVAVNAYLSDNFYYVEDTIQVPLNQWVYYAGVISSSGGSTSLKLYRNGDLVASNIFARALSADNGCAFWVGGVSEAPSSGCPQGYRGQYFSGLIDEVRLSDVARTDAEIHAQVDPGTSMVAHWNMDEASWNGTAGEVIDSSGHGINGTAHNGVTTVSGGKYNRAGSFDGIDDYVDVTNSALAQNQYSLFSISVWVKSPASSFGSVFVQQATLNNFNYGIKYDSTNHMVFFAGRNGYCSAVINSTDTFAPGNWYFITATYNNGQENLYVDGALEASGSNYCGGSGFSNGPALIGDDSDQYGVRQYHGLIDDLQIYDRILSLNEISSLYANGVNVTINATCPASVQARFTAGDIGLVKDGTYTQAILDGNTYDFAWSVVMNQDAVNPINTFGGVVTLTKPDNSTITVSSARGIPITLPPPTGTYTLEARATNGQLCDRAQIQVVSNPIPGVIIVPTGIVIETPTPTPTPSVTPSVTPTPTPDIEDVYVHDSTNNNIVAKMTVDMSVGRDWGAMTAFSRTKDQYDTGNTSILHYPGGAADIPGIVGGSFDLYVPKSPTDFMVRVCPGVASPSVLNEQCANGVDLRVGTTGQYTLAAVNLQGDDYWQITGVTGTGAVTIGNGIKDTLTRLQVSQASDHTVKYGTTNGLLSSGTTTSIQFDPAGQAWDMSTITINDINLLDDGVAKTLAASPGVNVWGVNINTTTDTITFSAPSSGTDYIAAGSEIIVKIGHNAGGTHQMVNPDIVNSYKVYMVNQTGSVTETGAAEIPIIDDDTVNVTGYLETFITFDIDTASTNSDCDALAGSLPCNSHGGSLDGAGYIVDLGEMTTSTVNVSGVTVLHADGLSGDINSIWFDLSTNADGGAVVKAYSLNNALLGPSSSTIPSVGSGQVQITAGSSLYGIQNRAGDAKTETSGFINIAADCSGSSGDTYYCSVGGATGRTIFDSFGAPVDAGRVQFRVGASPNSQNPTGTYTDELTFIATPTF